MALLAIGASNGGIELPLIGQIAFLALFLLCGAVVVYFVWPERPPRQNQTTERVDHPRMTPRSVWTTRRGRTRSIIIVLVAQGLLQIGAALTSEVTRSVLLGASFALVVPLLALLVKHIAARAHSEQLTWLAGLEVARLIA